MKLHIRKRVVQYGGPLMWVWWCGQEPEGPRCAMGKYGFPRWELAWKRAVYHAHIKHGVALEPFEGRPSERG